MNISMVSGRLVTIPKINIIQLGNESIALCCFTIAAIDGVFCETTKDLENENVDFFECVAFNECAKSIAENFIKGSKIICRGRMKNHNFTDYNGTKHFTQVFVIESIEPGDTESSLKKVTSKPKRVDLNVISDIKDIYYIFSNVCENGYLCIDENDYYKLACKV